MKKLYEKIHTKTTFFACKNSKIHRIIVVKLSISIPSTTVIVLFLTLFINVLVLKISLEKHFPIYVKSVEEQFQKQNNISPDGIEALLSINSLDSETQSDYNEAIAKIANISDSLKCLSENPVLYVISGSVDTSSTAFHLYSYEQLIEQARNENLLHIVTNPFNLDPLSAEWKFIYAIMMNFLIINAIWIAFVTVIYALWIRKIFAPIHLIIDSLQNFSSHAGQFLRYKKTDEFSPLIASLNNFRSSLDQQEKIRNNFLSDISHEIRTPITAISFMLEAISDGLMTLDAKNIKILQNELSRLVHITEAIMEHEKFLHSTENSEDKTICHLEEIFEIIVPQYHNKLEKNSQKIINNFSKLDKIFANHEQIEQVFHNIFSNFLKYAWNNSTLQCLYTKNKKYYILTFSDNGVGMKENELPLAKEKFFRADNTGRTKNSEEVSMGIWLSIVERIMILHNGFLELSHNTPTGFIITLYFPKND